MISQVQVNNETTIIKGSPRAFILTLFIYIITLSIYFIFPQIKSFLEENLTEVFLIINPLIFSTQKDIFLFYSNPDTIFFISYLEPAIWFTFISIILLKTTDIIRDFKSIFSTFVFNHKEKSVQLSFFSFSTFSFNKVTNRGNNILRIEKKTGVKEALFKTYDISILFKDLGQDFNGTDFLTDPKSKKKFRDRYSTNDTYVEEFHVWMINDIPKNLFSESLENILNQDFVTTDTSNLQIL